MMEIMTKEESYADRRQLFKNIWDTAMQIDEKDVDNIMAKPKVIKTLRLDEVDKFVIGKRKKERIKNLRTVCKKILDFCDRQDADDLFYEQKKDGKEAGEGEEQPENKLDETLKKNKKFHRRKRFKRAKSLYVPKKSSGNRATTSQRKDNHPGISPNLSKRINSPKTKRPATFNFVQRASVTTKRVLKAKSNTDAEGGNAPAKGSVTRRKVVRKKRSKQKKSSTLTWAPPGPSGASNNKSLLAPPTVSGRVIVKRIRQILTDNEIAVT
ncbi:hypothetical protein PYW08_015256 [Mythimna loreyi]|uniref:Uncharacterized protein n=1 Tax=Mythimna loreyi TaxID=667449 RepID=A0ACC2QVN9_9NEOP|nr:hypothetical protein PYW08_015256 [Mythimna loreyi]